MKKKIIKEILEIVKEIAKSKKEIYYRLEYEEGNSVFDTRLLKLKEQYLQALSIDAELNKDIQQKLIKVSRLNKKQTNELIEKLEKELKNEKD